MSIVRISWFCMVTPIGAALGEPSGLYVETMVSKIMPFENPKLANFVNQTNLPC